MRGEYVIQPEPMSFSFFQIWTGIEHTYPLLVGGVSTCDRLVRRDSFCLNLALEHWGSLLPHSRFLSRPDWGRRVGLWLSTDLRPMGEARDEWVRGCFCAELCCECHCATRHHSLPSALELPAEFCRHSINICWMNSQEWVAIWQVSGPVLA